MNLARIGGLFLRRALRVKQVFDAQDIPALEEHEKREFLLALSQRHALSIFIETGTYLGATTEFMAAHMHRCITIELDLHLYQQACKRLERCHNVEVLHGDGAERLAAALVRLDEPALFWLDAHYSHGRTARGDKDSPALRELDLIFQHTIDRHVIVLDDARHFLGLCGYPSLLQLRRMVSRRSKYSLRMRNDIIWIYRENI